MFYFLSNEYQISSLNFGKQIKFAAPKYEADYELALNIVSVAFPLYKYNDILTSFILEIILILQVYQYDFIFVAQDKRILQSYIFIKIPITFLYLYIHAIDKLFNSKPF